MRCGPPAEKVEHNVAKFDGVQSRIEIPRADDENMQSEEASAPGIHISIKNYN